MPHLLCFGDSLTFGSWDSQGGWVSRLRRKIDEKNLSDPTFYCLVYNLGVSGDASEDLIKRIPDEVNARRRESGMLLLIAIGTNDSYYIHSQKRNHVPIETFKENLEKIRKLTKIQIVHIGFFPVDETKTRPIGWNKDVSFTNDDLYEYNEAVKAHCKKNRIPFIDTFEYFSQLDYKKLTDDGLHPNDKGHELMAKLIEKHLKKYKAI